MTATDVPKLVLESRTIGRITGKKAGPTLIAVAGIHGNEHGGVHAARRVLALLGKDESHLSGELVVFGGNLGGMRDGVRYHAKDMNRLWSEARIAELEKNGPKDPEDHEQLELLGAIREAMGRARGPVYLVDLHTTSASGVPFVIFGDTLPQRHFVADLPLPIILGLEEQVDGVLSEYWTRQGCITFTVEGGQHRDGGSVDNLEAVLLLAAQSAGLFRSGAFAETRTAHALLEGRRGSLPRVMEVVSRHAIAEGDDFRMEPGFRNLDHAREGQLLARDKNGEVRAPKDGLVLLPLYQGLGSDGFFWGRAVGAGRLLASEALRTLKLDRFLDWLPGVERKDARRLELDANLAALYPMGVFQVLGYRRIRRDPHRVTIERQPE